MTADEKRRLLAEYAAGTLSASEREALFAAALDDQDLFDEIASTQPLAEAMADPVVRTRLLATLGEAPRKQRSWWPVPVGFAATMAAAAFVFMIGRERPDSETLIARRIEAPPAAVPPQAMAPRVESVPEKAKRQPMRTVVSPSQPATSRSQRVEEERRAKPAADAVTGPAENARADAAARQELAQADAPAAPAPAAAPPPPPAAPPRAGAPEPSAGGVVGGVIGGVPSGFRARPSMQIRSQARSIALPHQVLKRNEGVSFSAVPAGTEFDTGDSVKVAFALPAGTSFYILERGVAGPWQVLQKGVTPASGVVETPVLELATERRLLMVAGGTLESEAPAAVGSAAVRELSIADPSRTVQVTLRVRPKNR